MALLFVEDPYKPSFFATVSGKGSVPRHMWPWLKSNLVHPHTILAAMNPENCSLQVTQVHVQVPIILPFVALFLFSFTPEKTNMSPKMGLFQKESSLLYPIFFRAHVSFQGCIHHFSKWQILGVTGFTVTGHDRVGGFLQVWFEPDACLLITDFTTTSCTIASGLTGFFNQNLTAESTAISLTELPANKKHRDTLR